MSDNKIKVAVVFGGRSTEHEISLLSAQNVINSLDKNKYEALLIGIDKEGKWHYNEASMDLLNSDNAKEVTMGTYNNPIIISQNTNDKSLISVETHETISQIDVIFPVLHGTYGEDGSIQGFAKLANIPCVGCGILGSAVGMDKDIMKRILRDAGIGVAKWVTIRNSLDGINLDNIIEELGQELFVKPANLGSSVGVSHTRNREELESAITKALQYDPKVIVEEKITGREIECAVLGNQSPKASLPGEIIPRDAFYSFENKYLDENGAQLKIPAELSDDEIEKVQKLSIECYTVLECRGLSRVDMFLQSNGELILNEINTIPGFTNISMYPKLWEYSGLSQEDLISELIELAIAEHSIQNKLLLK